MRKLTLLLLGICLFCALDTWAQNTVTGRVTDANGLPIPGVTIKIKNSRSGTITSADGSFKINVPANGILIVSGVGFESKEITVSASKLSISLKQSDQSLKEVVPSLSTKRNQGATGYSLATVYQNEQGLRNESNPGLESSTELNTGCNYFSFYFLGWSYIYTNGNYLPFHLKTKHT